MKFINNKDQQIEKASEMEKPKKNEQKIVQNEFSVFDWSAYYSQKNK